LFESGDHRPVHVRQSGEVELAKPLLAANGDDDPAQAAAIHAGIIVAVPLLALIQKWPMIAT
jgi:hypothetical protein